MRVGNGKASGCGAAQDFEQSLLYERRRCKEKGSVFPELLCASACKALVKFIKIFQPLAGTDDFNYFIILFSFPLSFFHQYYHCICSHQMYFHFFINIIIEFVLTTWIFICFIIPHLPGEGC
jgi:hypothetical protein